MNLAVVSVHDRQSITTWVGATAPALISPEELKRYQREGLLRSR